jgi:hypothetical protein
VSPAVPPDAVVPRASVAPPAVSPRSTSTPPSPAVTPKLVEDNVLKDAEVSAFLHEVDRTYKDLVQQKIIADGPDALPTYQEYAARVDDLRKKLNAEKERSVR